MSQAYNAISNTKEKGLVQPRGVDAKDTGAGLVLIINQYFWPLSTTEAQGQKAPTKTSLITTHSNPDRPGHFYVGD